MITELTDEGLESLSGEMIAGQEVQLCLRFSIGRLQEESALDAVFALDDILREIIEVTDVGLYDGHEFCEGPAEESITFFMYGPDANLICETISPILPYLPKLPGSYIVKRYGNFGAKEEKISL